ncbi:unnamed protein product, partial [Heterosigma akashiwo]
MAEEEDRPKFPTTDDFPESEDQLGEMQSAASFRPKRTSSHHTMFPPPPQRHRSKSEADIPYIHKHIHSLEKKKPPDIRELMAIEDKQELKTMLLFERQRSVRLEREVDTLRHNQIKMSRMAEEEEEWIMNKFLGKLAALRAEKDALEAAVRTEHAELTGVLQKKLDQVRHEKVDLENQLEQEQEYLVNKLQQQLAQVMAEKERLAVAVEQEEEYLTNTLVKKMEAIRKEKEDLQAKLHHERTTVVAGMQRQVLELQAEKQSLGAKLEKDSEDLLALTEKALNRLHERHSESGRAKGEGEGEGDAGMEIEIVEKEDVLVEIMRRLTALRELGRSRSSSTLSA